MPRQDAYHTRSPGKAGLDVERAFGRQAMYLDVGADEILTSR